MTHTEIIGLIAIIITFMTSIAGLFINYRISQKQNRTQHELTELKNVFDANQELLNKVSPNRLSELEIIKKWVMKGIELHTEANYIKMQLIGKMNMVENKFDANTLVERASNWAMEIVKYGAIVEIYDVNSPISQQGTFPYPLSHLLFIYRIEILSFINQQLKAYWTTKVSGSGSSPSQIVGFPNDPGDCPKYPEQFDELYRNILKAIEHDKDHIAGHPLLGRS